MVLHDVVPRAERQLNGRTYSVFDELIRMEPSTYETYRVDVVCPEESDSEALATLFYDSGLGAEDWSAKVQCLCATCSLGSPHGREGSTGELTPMRSFGIAGPSDRVRQIDDLASGWKGPAVQGQPSLDGE